MSQPLSLPTGTVTFLFTDIEGSTKLWEAHPDAMRVTLARHDALMRAAIESQNGYVFKTVGDAFCAAFATAPGALAATLASQLALTAECWPDQIALKVRMVLHTGAVESRDNDYFGQPLNRVARLLATGYGGQTLLSQVTYDLVRDSLPLLTTLKDLGEHRLKDLARPEHVFQLAHPGLPGEFPPLKSLDSVALPNNLPQQVTSFIGREKELVSVQQALAKTRLLTLTGAGGSGKSRLALQAAADVLEQYPDGVWLVELAPLTDPQLVEPTVANVLGIKEETGRPLVATLTENLKTKKLLLLLDNCEHVLDASAKLADAVIRSCPQVQILATSREGLGIAGETTYRVPSLALPDPKQAQTAESLSQFEAVQLFIARAVQTQPAFAVTNANAPALASICFRLDGIPLAIELAAARARSLSVEEINTKLDQRFRLLTGGSRTALPRQQTLRSLIDWSYDLLSAAERALLCRLATFAGGWTLESAEQVCTDDLVEEWDVLDLLTSLVDKSLAVAEERDGATRYRLLETVRQYARDRLFESGAGNQWRGRHLGYFVSLAEAASEQLLGASDVYWLNRLEDEYDNVRVARGWAVEEDTESGLRLAGLLYQFWHVRGHLTEGRTWLSDLLTRNDGTVAPTVQARALLTMAHLTGTLGDDDEATTFYDASLALYRESGDKAGQGEALMGQGVAALRLGDLSAAMRLSEESRVLAREIGHKVGVAWALNTIGIARIRSGDYTGAKRDLEECLAIARQEGNRRIIRAALHHLGNVAFRQKDYEAAKRYGEEDLTIARESGDKPGLVFALLNQTNLALHAANYAQAQSQLAEAITLGREMGLQKGWSVVLRQAASVALHLSGSEKAIRLFRAAKRVREDGGGLLGPAHLLDDEAFLSDVRAASADEAALRNAEQEGSQLTREQAIDYALALGEPAN